MSTRIISAESVIQSLFMELCDACGAKITNPDSSLSLLFTLEVSCDNYGYENDGNTHRPEWVKISFKYLHVIINCHRRVFVAVSDKMNYKEVPLEDFKNTSNHDSCWRSDGLRDIFSVYHQVYNDCWENPAIPKEHKKAPSDANIQGRFFFTDNPFRYVKIDWVTEEHQNRLTSINEVQYKITIID